MRTRSTNLPTSRPSISRRLELSRRLGVSGSLLLLLALAVSGCATRTPPQQAANAGEDFHDPFEDTNRKIFQFNEAVDHHVLVPVAKAYRAALPGPVRNSVHDFLNNLTEPLVFANDTLQGRFGPAKDTVVRFVLNSTLGIGGLVDLAGRWGIPYHEADLGITFGVWGIPAGPYLVLPVLGPSDPRDLSGEVAEGFGDPWNRLVTGNPFTLYWIPFVRGGVSGIDQRSRYLDTLADIERTSLDYYATIRSLYRQRRAALIRGQNKNLPPPAGLTENDAPTMPANPDRPGLVVSAAPNGLKVSW